MKLSENRRLPDGSYDLTGRDLHVLQDFLSDMPVDTSKCQAVQSEHLSFEETLPGRLTALEKRNAILEAQVTALTKRLDELSGDGK
jgi:hypothetical protein